MDEIFEITGLEQIITIDFMIMYFEICLLV